MVIYGTLKRYVECTDRNSNVLTIASFHFCHSFSLQKLLMVLITSNSIRPPSSIRKWKWKTGLLERRVCLTLRRLLLPTY